MLLALSVQTHAAGANGFIQQGENLVGAGATGPANFGYATALSADGNTAMVGGPGNGPHGEGAVWVFTRSGASWTQQGEKLTVSDEAGPLDEGARFGSSIALSADGNTAVIGGPGDYFQSGAAWVFTRTGSSWHEQSKINKEGGAYPCLFDRFGSAVALSANGNTALIGCPGENGGGTAWVFTRTGETWTQQSSKLTGSGQSSAARFGAGVALSADGNTALIGAPANEGGGSAWIFSRSGETWTQQGAPLAVDGGISESAEFGETVALSGDGNTALIGAPNEDEPVGAAWVFVQTPEGWTQQSPKLVGVGEIGEGAFGMSLALSSDGNTALIGAPYDSAFAGAVWEFLRLGETWTQDGQKLTGAGEGREVFGQGMALSADAQTALVGAPSLNEGVGLASALVNEPTGPAPTVARLSSKKGPSVGGVSVTITGTNFETVAAVRFGAALVRNVTINSPTSITVITPPGTSGQTDVTVQTPNGTSEANNKDRYTFEAPVVSTLSPASGSKLGGFAITVTGGGFGVGTAATTFKVGKGIATAVHCASASRCTMLAPAAAKAGPVDVRATANGKTSKKNPPTDQFVYQ